jgi:protein TIF31
LVEDPYTEKEARIHFIRIRELIGAAGDHTDIVHGVLPGISLLDTVALSTPANTEAENTQQPFSDYQFNSPEDLTILLPRSDEAAPKTVKSISLSSWNPPPSYLRQKGHLLYLVVTTNEGEQHQITSHVGGFFVNKSSNSKFDPFPRPAPKGNSAHSLLSLINSISTSFSESFSRLQEHNNKKDPLATFQITNSIPSAPWIVPPSNSPACAHTPDSTRPQETYLIAGAENTDTLRDWNEEFQSAKELPKETVQDRVFRERLMSKLYADYNDAATKGAVMVARGEITPLNPTEDRDAQIFVYNNIFFSFGADGVGTFTSEGGHEAARVATGKDIAGVRIVNQLDIDGLFTPATVVIDYLGKRIVSQSIVPGIFKQREPGENQIDYGAVDGKDVVASDQRFVSVFEKLSRALKVKRHSVWDKEGQKFELEASVETKGLMGTDGRKYVLDLYRITPLDIAWLEDITPSETQSLEQDYPHRMTVLRPELVESLARQKMKEWFDAELVKRSQASATVLAAENNKVNGIKVSGGQDLANSMAENIAQNSATDTSTEDKPDKLDSLNVADFHFALNPDAFSGQVPQTDADKSELESDEADVRAACGFLRNQVIPDLLRDLIDSEISFPMDGSSLGRLLHKRGVNVRYIGMIANLCQDSKLKCLRDVCVQDMVARAFKHIVAVYLRNLPLPLASPCISHLLNCLVGYELNARPTSEVDPTIRAVYVNMSLGFEDVTVESLRTNMEEQVLQRFRFLLQPDWHQDLKPLQLLREVSLKLGLQLQAKDFAFKSNPQNTSRNGVSDQHTSTTINGAANSEAKKKKKKTRETSPASISSVTPVNTFTPDDIVNIVPIVKHSCPRSTLAEEALEAGRISIIQNQKKLGQELLLESLSLHEQIYGILHPEVARVYNTLSMLYYQLDEKDAAVELARKAVVVSERTVGVDSAETLLNYLNLSLFIHQNGDSRGALIYVRHALELWKIIYGPDHPDSITTINNAAVMLQHLKAYHESRLWFEESLRICEAIFGKQSINAATLLFQLAQALALDNDSKGAVNRMRESYNIFLNELGPADKNTKEAESWLEQLTHNAVSIAKHAKDVQARRLRAGIRFSASTPFDGSSTAQSSQSAIKQTREGTSSQIDSRSIDELIKFIEGTDDKAKSTKRRPGRANPKRRGNVV